MRRKLIQATTIAVLAAVTALAGPDAAPSAQESAKAASVTTLTVSAGAEQTVTLTATVRPHDAGESEAPRGVVEFFDVASLVGTAPITDTEAGTVASLSVTLSAGPHHLTANYKGDVRFEVSISAPVVHMVRQ